MGVIGGLDLLRPRVLRPDAVEAVYAEGWGYDQRLAVDRATLRLGASEVQAVAVAVQRDDVANRHIASPWHSPFARNSGVLFAGIVGPLESGSHPLELELTLEDGTRVTAFTDQIVVAARPVQAPLVVPNAEVAVVMATHNPTPTLFERQVASIRAQQQGNWCCVVCDDASSPEHLDAMRTILADDRRFVLVENEQRLGFYLNFERALYLTPPGVRFVALSDQDDVWHPSKLRRQVETLQAEPGTQLVASDVRVVEASGAVIAPTFYSRRSPTYSDKYSLFVVNTLVGASMVFRRELLDLALPFPRAFLDRFHDHWLARSALVAGNVGFVASPLHDYVQHEGNVFGSRQGVRWPLGPAMKLLLWRWMGSSAALPREWRDHFIDTSLEASTAAQLLCARRRNESPGRWLDRVNVSSDGEWRELCHIVADHTRERCTKRPRRESVEYVQFTGRSWRLIHRPGDRCS